MINGQFWAKILKYVNGFGSVSRDVIWTKIYLFSLSPPSVSIILAISRHLCNWPRFTHFEAENCTLDSHHINQSSTVCPTSLGHMYCPRSFVQFSYTQHRASWLVWSSYGGSQKLREAQWCLCPRSLAILYSVTFHIKWVKTSSTEES